MRILKKLIVIQRLRRSWSPLRVLLGTRKAEFSTLLGQDFPQCSVLLAEALAVREDCLLCIKNNISYAVIENDLAVGVSWCLKEDGEPPWDIFAVIADIKSLFSVRRSVSRLAHWAAKFCLFVRNWSLDPCNFPLYLKSLARKEAFCG